MCQGNPSVVKILELGFYLLKMKTHNQYIIYNYFIIIINVKLRVLVILICFVMIDLEIIFFLPSLSTYLIESRGVKLIFTGGHISFAVAFKGPNVILGLYKINYSLTRGKELGAAGAALR